MNPLQGGRPEIDTEPTRKARPVTGSLFIRPPSSSILPVVLFLITVPAPRKSSDLQIE
ncbi:MAG: hypothetical protein ACD_75C02481G0002 [uncultured bacterium]|nr:MAG: hypothetical protein ACD_75C02481G0002 [uncultured bacterium]